ncbi:GNAT family N-acetyltransferase [Phytomonospora sp. NPDC050363]|uniref:GNAT family N-acetyltransferase n=1 Tax=Phytomonospora sp. NPDC050363 TaxID=3155642 RepID=UPI0033DC2988
MSDTMIREAVPGDVAGLVECSVALFAEDGGTRDATLNVDWPKEFSADSIRAGIDDPARLILAAVRDGEVVGQLSGKVAEAVAIRPVRVATLVSLYVRPEARDGGLGAQLVAAFKDWARTIDADRIAVTAYATNEAAIRFYRRCGFEPYQLTLEADL